MEQIRHISFQKMIIIRTIRKILRWTIILFFGSSLFFVLLYKWMPVPLTPLMIMRCGQQVSQGKKLKLQHHWVSKDDISPSLALSVIASEDQRFLQHHGFDFEEIEKVLKNKSKKRQRGASTISQQTAKNVFLTPHHSWIRKGFEVYFTALIELFWSKQRILEVYLNSIEMAGGIYGAEAIAQQHFNCKAKDLTANQCALIAATLPNPLKFSSLHPSGYVLKRQSFIIKQMRNLGKPEHQIFTGEK